MASKLDPLMVKIQTQLLQVTFIKNMTLLQNKMPTIYEYYKDYIPTKVQLKLDDDSRVNLLANGQFVYQGDPRLESQAQVDAFSKSPVNFDYEIIPEETYFYQHQQVVNEIFNKRIEEIGSSMPSCLHKNGDITFLAIMGAGLGYHIEILLTQFSIRSVFLFEPEPDCFFSALHCVDFEPLLAHCTKRGGEFTIKIGGDEYEYVNDINASFKSRGYFNCVKMYLYRHYISDKTTDAFKLINDLGYRYQSGWGFCEDEVIGISHTLTNISENNAPILLTSAKQNKRNLPVFVIGNGPSLNTCIEYLKVNQDNAIIFSSGTTLKPLLNNDIIPDFHVEQERPATIYQWVKKIGHEKTLKKIDLICLNTVYPKILSLFKKAYIVLKAGDAGTTFIHDSISKKYEELFFSNPTVTNASTAIAIAMGFKRIYLFGLDYGFKTEGEQHAQGSIYDDIKDYKLSKHLEVLGNFGGNIETTRTFDFSRGVLEMLLAENTDVQCLNTSDGAKITHTIPIKITDMPIFPLLKGKQKYAQKALSSSFNNNYWQQCNIIASFQTLQPKFQQYIKQLIEFTANVKTRLELVNAFTVQYQFLNDVKNDSTKKLFLRFMSGSLNYLQSTVVSNVYYFSKAEDQSAFISFSLNKMNDHFIWLVNDLAQNYNQPAKR
ncbi:MAG: motility associated factor glycosyltransferase family protein [Psychromonas sp.]|nr:motility associated factor glycosyltransferase family protein [Psychromonas sp.]